MKVKKAKKPNLGIYKNTSNQLSVTFLLAEV